MSAEPDHPYADAVAIRGDRIIGGGDLAAVERTAGPGARKVDLKGKFPRVVPGQRCSRCHSSLDVAVVVQFPQAA